MTAGLGDQDEVGLVQTQAAFGFGDHDPGQTQVKNLTPARFVARVAVVHQTAQVCARAFGPQQGADDLGDGLLFVGEGEIHDQPLGRPSRRSAMMLRWISFDPA
ncbi:hypothetical protein D3C87_1244770 [compost metagenome]